MLKAGAIILSIWSVINFLLASFILVIVVCLGKKPPMLYIVFDEPEISTLDTKILSATKSLAILFNSSIAAASLLALFIIWSSMVHGQRWAFWSLLISIALVQIFGFVADSAIGNKTAFVNIIFTALYIVGISLAGYSIFLR